MDYEELISRFTSLQSDTKTISLSVSTPDQRVVRIHIRFDPVVDLAKSQFVIAAGNDEMNLDIKAMLTGVEISRPKKRKVSRVAKALITKTPETPESPPSPIMQSGMTHRRTTILLNDAFYFDQNLSVYALLALLDQLSDKYMDYQSFHAQLETTDGDYHFDIQREELRYMFNQRKHTLLNLYFYNSNKAGHWIDIALSFHPLGDVPNAEVELCSTGSTIDDISDLIQDSISIPPPKPIEIVDESFSFDPSGFSIEKFIALFNHISHHFFFRIPPVASLTTRNQKAYTGLSFFQLEKLYREQAKNTAAISVEMIQQLTGQVCRAEVFFDENAASAKAKLTIVLGDNATQIKIRDLVKDRMGRF